MKLYHLNGDNLPIALVELLKL